MCCGGSKLYKGVSLPITESIHTPPTSDVEKSTIQLSRSVIEGLHGQASGFTRRDHPYTFLELLEQVLPMSPVYT